MTKPRTFQHPAFTLVEMMISIALVLILMLGVNQVFKATTQTVGTGFAVSQVTREQRAMERVLSSDFEKMVKTGDAPFIYIHSQTQFAYRDPNDMKNEPNGLTFTDLYGYGPEQIPSFVYNFRNHRIDRVAFFAKDVNTPFNRQTGNQSGMQLAPALVWPESSPEALIWYGHLRIPNNKAADPRGYNPNNPAQSGDFYQPGQLIKANGFQPDPSTNPNNTFVNQWYFGRVGILLKNSPTGDYFRRDDTAPGNTAPDYNLTPLGLETVGGGGPNNTYAVAVEPSYTNTALTPPPPSPNIPWLLPYSRYDVAQTGIAAYRRIMDEATARNPSIVGFLHKPFWYQEFDYRFNAKPWATRATNQDTMAAEVALTHPLFEKGVAQFIVEYAGDYVTQVDNPGFANDGNVLTANSYVPDGKIDWITDPATLTRRIRWYGMPRNVTGRTGNVYGDGKQRVTIPRPAGPVTNTWNQFDQVVPLRDLAGPNFPRINNIVSPFEFFYKIDPSGNAAPAIGASTEYANPTVMPVTNPPSSATGVPYEYHYVAAWTPQQLALGYGPKLIRITIQINDATGRLPEGQMYEYIYAVPH